MINREELVKKYPFIDSNKRHLWFFDDVPKGWMDRFGVIFLDDLKDVLERNNCLDSIKITNVDVDDGSLVFKASGYPEEWRDHLAAWQYIFKHTCADCGAFPVSLKKMDSITAPLCRDCAMKRLGENAKGYYRYLDLYDEEDGDYKLLSELTYSVDDIFAYPNEVKVDLLPFYEKIGYAYKEDEQYGFSSSKMPDEDYKELCDDVYRTAIDFWKKYGEPIDGEFSHNSEVVSEIPLTGAYRRYIYQHYMGQNIKPEDIDIELVPHFYTYPYMAMPSIGWRMGSGEQSSYFYWDWFNSLPLEEKKRHRRKYPIPYCHDDEKMFDVVIDELIDPDEKELVVFVFKNKETGEEYKVNARYYDFSEYSKKEQNRVIEETRIGLASKLSQIEISEKYYSNDLVDLMDSRLGKLYKKLKNEICFVKWEKRDSETDSDKNE